MILFHILSTLMLIAVAIWLYQQGRDRSQVAYALNGLIAYQVALLVLSNIFPAIGDGILPPLLQLVAWAVLLTLGLKLPWHYVGIGAILVAVLTVFFPESGNVATWGFLPAVPLVVTFHTRDRSPRLPILAPRPPLTNVRPDSSVEGISRERIEAQRPILECIADGVLVNNNDGIIEYVNQAAATIIGVEADRLVGQKVTEALAWLPSRTAPEGAEEVPTHSKLEVDGRVVESQMNIIYDEEGAVRGTVAVLRDITAAHEAEKAKSAFLTTVSHELRTPLTTIKGYVELLAGGTGGNLNSNQQQFLTTIQRNVTRMVHLINGLIFVSSVKGQRYEFPDRQADLRRLLDQIVREMNRVAGQNEQSIDVDVDSRLPPVQADPIHISTILQELIANAVKYNRPGGTVRIRATQEATTEDEQTFAVVSVSDDGIGISESDQSHIFDDFYRPDKHDEEVKAGGIGVGLSIVRALVEAYNGRVWVESQANKGSTFTFIIPTRQPKPVRDLLD